MSYKDKLTRAVEDYKRAVRRQIKSRNKARAEKKV